MYQVEFTPEAVEDLRYFRKFEQNVIVNGVQTQLTYEPTLETKNRFRRNARFEYFTMLTKPCKSSASKELASNPIM